MSTSRLAVALLCTPVYCAAQWPVGPLLGAPATAAETAAWGLMVKSDGTGLPAGSGTPAQGRPIFRQKCEKCHGEKGRGASAEELVGGIGTLSSDYPDRTLGSYWPHAPTIFDYIRRAMPIDAPWSLSDHEVYALTAYLLYLNKLIPREDYVLDAKSLAGVHMPNRVGFIPVYGAGKSP